MDGGLVLKIGAGILAALIGIGSWTILRMKQDNAVEETAEEVLKKFSGVDVDLSPQTPENRK